MDFEEIKSIVELMSQNSISEFELKKEDFKIKLKRGSEGFIASTSEGGPYLLSPPPPQPLSGSGNPPSQQPDSSETNASSTNDDTTNIISPMIGTFYVAPSPEAAPYVEVGAEVQPETVVCIIEAMKVMNEIKAETKGVITKILVENAKPVEYGRPLFKVKPL